MALTPTGRKRPGEKVGGFRTSKLKKVILRNEALSPVLAHHLPLNRFFWLQPATPEAAGCFHLFSRRRLCCHRCVNITLLHSWGYSFTYTAIIIASHLCSGAPAAARRHESRQEIDLWQASTLFWWKWERLERMRVCVCTQAGHKTPWHRISLP